MYQGTFPQSNRRECSLHAAGIGHRTQMCGLRTWTMAWGWLREWEGLGGQKGENGDNGNSIINKMEFKFLKEHVLSHTSTPQSHLRKLTVVTYSWVYIQITKVAPTLTLMADLILNTINFTDSHFTVILESIKCRVVTRLFSSSPDLSKRRAGLEYCTFWACLVAFSGWRVTSAPCLSCPGLARCTGWTGRSGTVFTLRTVLP